MSTGSTGSAGETRFRIAHPSEHWLTGGIITELTWDAGECDVWMWDGRQRRVYDGDTVLLFHRGLRASLIVGVEPAKTTARPPLAALAAQSAEVEP